MKWLLAGSQLLLLAVLLYRGTWRAIPAFSCFLAFAFFSSITYDPWNTSRFAAMSLPSILLRCLVCLECVWILTSGDSHYARILMQFSSIIGSLIVLSASWGVSRCYGAVITFAVYCALGIAGALWTVIGILWHKQALVRDWRRGYVLAVAIYFGVLALARVSTHWNQAQNISVWAYILIFCWLTKRLYDQKDRKDQQPCDTGFDQNPLEVNRTLRRPAGEL